MKAQTTIRANVSSGILDKADRLFTNDDRSVWVELLQNSRRAGATLVNVSIVEEAPNLCWIVFEDNGAGIEDFQKLLTLGGSGWDAHTRDREDPAGMGFFALCRSTVIVSSGFSRAEITPEVFLGKTSATVELIGELVRGTRIEFSRESTKFILRSALEQVTQFCPLEVHLDGVALPRNDFLDGALHREVIDGIEVGFATRFTAGFHPDDQNWNFYGARIRGPRETFHGYLEPGKGQEPEYLQTRFNVLGTAKVKLQLPDRRAIIEDEHLAAFRMKVRAAAYRFFKTQFQHGLPYHNWAEAKGLGVNLPEAVWLLTSWEAKGLDDGIESPFGFGHHKVLTDLSDVLLVSDAIGDSHTLAGALCSSPGLKWHLYQENRAWNGYSWYDRLPKITETNVFLDEVPFAQWPSSTKKRPAKIEIELTMKQAGKPDSLMRVPAFIHVDSESANDLEFVAVADSPWDNDELSGTFPVVAFLVWATFQSSDSYEADSWDTQRDYYESEVQSEADLYFRGPRATLLSILRQTFGWRATELAQELGIREIRFLRTDTPQNWTVEIPQDATSGHHSAPGTPR